MSRDVRAGVDVPDAVTEGCLLSDLWFPVAAARSAEAWDMPWPWPPVTLPAWPWVDKLVIPLAATEADVDGVWGMLRVLKLDEERR